MTASRFPPSSFGAGLFAARGCDLRGDAKIGFQPCQDLAVTSGRWCRQDLPYPFPDHGGELRGQVQGMVPGCLYGQSGPRLRPTGVQVPDPGRDQHPVSTSGNITKTLLLVCELPAACGQMSRDLSLSPVKRALFCAGITVRSVGALELIVQRSELLRDCGGLGTQHVATRCEGLPPFLGLGRCQFLCQFLMRSIGVPRLRLCCFRGGGGGCQGGKGGGLAGLAAGTGRGEAAYHGHQTRDPGRTICQPAVRRQPRQKPARSGRRGDHPVGKSAVAGDQHAARHARQRGNRIRVVVWMYADRARERHEQGIEQGPGVLGYFDRVI